jgi:hypothetical protein
MFMQSSRSTNFAALTVGEQEFNRGWVASRIQSVTHESPRTDHTDAILSLIMDFTNENRITLKNLVVDQEWDEEQQLVGIIKEALQSRLPLIEVKGSLTDKLNEWKNTLTHAVAGQGPHVALHNTQPTGIIDRLLRDGCVSADAWGTDKDARDYLGEAITDPQRISTTGSFILPPVSLTESDGQTLENRLNEAITAIKDKQINGKVNLLILANGGDSHWITLKIGVKNQSIKSAVWWDPLDLSTDSIAAVKKTPAFTNAKCTLKRCSAGMGLGFKSASVQSDGSSCLFHCLQEAEQCLQASQVLNKELSHNSMSNATVDVLDSRQLRWLAIQKIVARSTDPMLKKKMAGKQLALQSNGSVVIELQKEIADEPCGALLPTQSVLPAEDEKMVAADQLLESIVSKDGDQVSSAERNWQLDFDLALSLQLEQLINDARNRLVDENRLFEQAKKLALAKVGLFSPNYERKIQYKTEQPSVTRHKPSSV